MRLSLTKCRIRTALILVTLVIITARYIIPASYRMHDRNYFGLSSSPEFQSGFLVDNGTCRIPNVSVWNEQVKDMLQEDFKPRCQNEQRAGTVNGLTFVRKQASAFIHAIVIDETLLMETLGLKLSDIYCCYQTIQRLQQDPRNYTRDADKTFQFSEQCFPMTSAETLPTSGFIRVNCTSRGIFWDTLIHTDLHLLATFQGTAASVRHKLEFWNKIGATGKPHPPNVLILGIDSTSRLNFQRFMPKTRKLLEEVFGAVEMGGYTKVGENTFPNFVPLMSSYSEDELVDICYRTRWTAQDRCPYIWRNFSNANYLTAMIEDAPSVSAFNSAKTGFVLPPVDMYPRAWMLAAYTAPGPDRWNCIDSRTTEQIIIRYVVDLVELAERHGIPYFIMTWLTELTHDYMNSLQTMDSVMENALVTLWNGGHLRNTVLIVMGDHGYRFLKIRRTFFGWLEDKLPALWIALPGPVKRLKPGWEEALRYNSKELVTPFDMHETLKDILSLSSLSESGAMTTRSMPLRGRSLFGKLPPRSCKEAGVPSPYCACAPPVKFTGNTSEVRAAADAVVSKINSGLPSPLCSRLRVGSITAAGVHEDDDGNRILVVGIRTAPEDIELEALFSYNSSFDKWEILDYLRTDQIRESLPGSVRS